MGYSDTVGVYIRSSDRMGIFFWVTKISSYLGVLDIPDIFGVNSRFRVHAYV